MFALIFAAAAAAATQMPEWAEAPPPRLPDSMYVTLDRYRYFTDCVAGREWVTARPLFDTRIGSAEEDAVFSRILPRDETECSYTDRMRMTSILMRGGFAESRYRHVYGSAPVPPVPAEAAPVPQGATFEWVGFARDSDASDLHAFALCLAERESGGVHALLLTRIGRGEERIAYQALSRRFGTCLRPGQHLRANSLTLRPWLAEALYQQARARQPDVGD